MSERDTPERPALIPADAVRRPRVESAKFMGVGVSPLLSPIKDNDAHEHGGAVPVPLGSIELDEGVDQVTHAEL